MAPRVEKPRALTELLKQAGRRTQLITGEAPKRLARQKILAETVWQLATTQRAILPDGEEVSITSKEWTDIIKWLFTQIDGPAQSKIDLTSDGKAVNFKVYGGFDPDQV